MSKVTPVSGGIFMIVSNQVLSNTAMNNMAPNKLARNLLALLVFAFVTMAGSSVLAQNDLTFGNDNLSAEDDLSRSSQALSGTPEFLDYDEAYILTATVADNKSSPAGQIFLRWDIEPGYYLYHKEFRVKGYVEGEPIAVDYEIPSGIVKYDEAFDEDREVFYDNVSIPVTFPGLSPTSKVQLSVRAQGCADAGLCYVPKTKYFEVDFDRGTAIATGKFAAKQGPGSEIKSPAVNPPLNNGGNNATSSTESIGGLGLLYSMLLALAGGVILNLMPCVFPVLSLKALSFISAKGSEHSHHLHGWVYTAGVIASFLVMGAIIIGIRAAGGSADWGVQLQSPLFVTAMVYLFLLMGLSLSGFVHFGSSLMGIGQSLTTREGLQGSFFTGVLAVIVASPCSAPFMATALGVALTQSAPIALAIFASLGLGLALPFLILSHSPKLASYLPKPGAWMETLKQVLAFPLYLTAAAGLWILGRQTGSDTVAAVVLGAIAIVFAIWLWQKRPRTSFGKYSQIAFCLAVTAGGLALAVQAPQYGKGDYWQEYSEDLVAQYRSEGRPVFINMTAAWCTTCHANELIALSRKEVKEAAEKYNIAMIKGDYTNEDPRITKLLNQYNRPSVPLYLMYAADSSQPAEILPQVLTADTVIAAMQRAATSPTLAHNR